VVWADSGISHTKKFENKSISTLQATHCQKTAAELMRISDDKMCGIMHRSVLRGLEQRDLSSVKQISLDENSYGKEHQYISVLTDSRTGTVLDVSKDRTEQSADNLIKRTLNPDRLTCITTTCCDMWDAFISDQPSRTVEPNKRTAKLPRFSAWFKNTITSIT